MIEAARTLLGWDDANSEEFNKDTKHPVVVFMPEGAQPFLLLPDGREGLEWIGSDPLPPALRNPSRNIS